MSFNIFTKSIFEFFIVNIHVNGITYGKTSFVKDICVSSISFSSELSSLFDCSLSLSFLIFSLPVGKSCISSSSFFNFNSKFTLSSFRLFVNVLFINFCVEVSNSS